LEVLLGVVIAGPVIVLAVDVACMGANDKFGDRGRASGQSQKGCKSKTAA
jgi:hypothetical protein